MARMKVVVTGAAGFIGSVLSARALVMGHEVIALDDLSRGLNPVHELEGITFLKWDCRQGLPPEAEGADAVVHLAAATGSLERPIEELRLLNVEMLKTVYAAAGEVPFLWPTTSLALGVPDSPYVRSKEEGLEWLRHKPQAIPLRFFNVTGEYVGLTERRQREVHIVPTLVTAYKDAVPFIINGGDYATADGTPARDYVNVVDLADYLLTIIGGARPTPHHDGCIWVGTGETTTTKHVVDTFQQHIGFVKATYGPRRPFDVGAIRCADWQVDQFRDMLGHSLTGATTSILDESLSLLE